jgi:hypothetical protein
MLNEIRNRPQLARIVLKFAPTFALDFGGALALLRNGLAAR